MMKRMGIFQAHMKCLQWWHIPLLFFYQNPFSLKNTLPGSVPLGKGRGSAKRREGEIMEKGKLTQSLIREFAASVEEGWKRVFLGLPSPVVLVVEAAQGWDWKFSSALGIFFPKQVY